jgi:molybdopterin-guanine dinucleotide biosynthesis protein A
VICGLVLAGGRSSRFGSDKAVAMLEGQTLLARVAAILRAGCDRVAVSAPTGSRAADLADQLEFEVVSDIADSASGPLSGVLSGLLWAQALGADALATAPCDTPFLPADVVARLAEGLDDDHPVAAARTPDGLQPLCAIWRTSLAQPLALAMDGGRHPAVHGLFDQLGGCVVDFEDAAAFWNINTRQDLDAAARAPPKGD